jgi:hypothetical protein
VPRIEHRLVAPEATAVITDNLTILTQFDPIGIGADFHRSPDRTGRHRVFVLVELNQAGLRDRRGHAVEPVKAPGIRDEAGTFGFEHLPDGLVTQFGMTVRLGVSDALVQQPAIQLVVAFDPKSWGEEPLPYQTDLVLDLTLLPA